MNWLLCTQNKGKVLEFEHALGSQCVVWPELVEKRWGTFEEGREDANSFLANALAKLFSASRYFEDFDTAKGSYYLVDDSGLCVPALQFMPGVHSATYAGRPRDDARNRQKLIQAITRSPEAHPGPRRGEKQLEAFFVCHLLKMSYASAPRMDRVVAGSEIVTDALLEFESQILEELMHGHGHRANPATRNLLPADFLRKPFKNIAPTIEVYSGIAKGWVSTLEGGLNSKTAHGYDYLFYGAHDFTRTFAELKLEEKNRVSHRAAALRALRD